MTAKPHHINCANCKMSALCLPLALESSDIDKLDEIVRRSRPLQKGEHLYRSNDAFQSVYAVRSGAIKLYTISGSGQEQAMGFCLPGEIFGMDSLHSKAYINSAVALETSSICEIPFTRFEELSHKIPSLQRHFISLMSREMSQDQQLITLLGTKSADERVAALLVNIARRQVRQGLSETRYRLPMSRAEIGSYLGLTIETVSRVFSRLQQKGLIEANRKEVEIKDIDLLCETANIQP